MQRDPISEFAILFLIIAGIASVAMSGFGLFAMAWGGAWEGSNIGGKILHLLVWLLPTLSTVAFVSYFVSKKVGLLSSWTIAIGSIVTILIQNLNSCLAGNCTTSNPFKIALGVFLLPPIWILLAASLGLQLATSIRGNSVTSSEEETSRMLN